MSTNLATSYMCSKPIKTPTRQHLVADPLISDWLEQKHLSFFSEASTCYLNMLLIKQWSFAFDNHIQVVNFKRRYYFSAWILIPPLETSVH